MSKSNKDERDGGTPQRGHVNIFKYPLDGTSIGPDSTRRHAYKPCNQKRCMALQMEDVIHTSKT